MTEKNQRDAGTILAEAQAALTDAEARREGRDRERRQLELDRENIEARQKTVVGEVAKGANLSREQEILRAELNENAGRYLSMAEVLACLDLEITDARQRVGDAERAVLASELDAKHEAWRKAVKDLNEIGEEFREFWNYAYSIADELKQSGHAGAADAMN